LLSSHVAPLSLDLITITSLPASDCGTCTFNIKFSPLGIKLVVGDHTDTVVYTVAAGDIPSDHALAACKLSPGSVEGAFNIPFHVAHDD
jgi:hypothetical protein